MFGGWFERNPCLFRSYRQLIWKDHPGKWTALSNFRSLPFSGFRKQQRRLEILGVSEEIAGAVVAVWGYHPQQNHSRWPVGAAWRPWSQSHKLTHFGIVHKYILPRSQPASTRPPLPRCKEELIPVSCSAELCCLAFPVPLLFSAGQTPLIPPLLQVKLPADV